MRILFLTDNFPPEVNAPAVRTFEHARLWVRAGHQVTVITCAPNFPRGRVFEGYRNRLVQREQLEGIRVVRVWTYIAENKGFLKRSLDYLSFALAATVAGLFEDADVVVATSPQFFTTWAGWALSRIKRRPWVFELRDLWPETIEAVGAVKHRWLLDLLERVELALYRDADAVVPVTPAFKANLTRRGIDPAKIHVVTNGVDRHYFQPRGGDPELRARLGLTQPFIIGYIGTHGLCHGLDFIVEHAAALAEDGVGFLFVGDGAAKAELVAQARRLGLQNVVFSEPVKKEEVADYLALVDASLVPLRKSDTFKTVIPSKIFESAAMRKPILLGVEGQAKQILDEFGAGLSFEPENAAEFLAAARQLVAGSSTEALQAGCDRLAAAYGREELAGEMLEVLQGLAGRRAAPTARGDRMRIVIITQDEPFFLAENIDYLLSNMPPGAEVVGCVVSAVSPFGKKASFKDKALQTYRVFGNRFFAYYALQYLRRRLSRAETVEQVLARHGAPKVELTGSINSVESRAALAALKPDLMISIAGNELFRKKLRALPPKGILNLHTALLPKYRGLMPSFWVLKNDERETGVSVFFVDKGIDSGPIVVQKRIEIGDMSQAELIRHSKRLGMEAILEAVELIMKDEVELIPNPDEEKSYFSFPTREDVREFYRAGKRFF